MPRSAAAAYAVPAPGPNLRPPPVRLGQITAVVGFVALLVLTLAHPSATRIHTWPWALLGFGLWLLPLFVLVIGALRSPVWRLPPRTFLAGMILLAGGTLVSAWLTPFADASLPRVWPTFGGCALLLCLYHGVAGVEASKNQLQARLQLLLALAGATLAGLALLWWSELRWPLRWTARNDFSFGHSTYTAGAMVVLLPWVALQAWLARGGKRTAWLFATGVMVLVLASTSSRGGVLGLAAAATLAAAAILSFGRWSKSQRVAAVAGLLALSAVVIATNPRLRELVVNRQWGALASESNSQRSAMIAAGVELGLERPLLGWGAGTVPLAYPGVRARLEGGVENVLQLHSTPFQVGATLGLVGLAALIFLLTGVIQSVRSAPRTPSSMAAAASLVGYAVVALTDHQMDVPMISASVVAGAALLLGSVSAGAASSPPTRNRRIALTTLLVIAAAIPLPATWRDLQARGHYDHALGALAAGDQPALLRALDDATDATPHDPFFDHFAASSQLQAASQTADPEQRRRRIQDAMTRLERSLISGAHREFAHFNLGWLYLETGQPAAATRHFRSAAALVPDKGGVYFGLGLALRGTGAHTDAVRAFALEWINDPLSFTSPVWEIDDFTALIPAIRTETLRVLGTLETSAPAAGPLARWLNFWWQPETPSTAPNGWNAETRAFAAAWQSLQTKSSMVGDVSTAPWRNLYEPWRRAAPAADFTAPALGDSAFAAALARRAAEHPHDFRAVLVASTGGEATLVRVSHRARPGYGVLALHPEGPPLQDAYVVQENRVATQFAAELFPRKGWLPGRLLLALLPENSR